MTFLVQTSYLSGLGIKNAMQAQVCVGVRVAKVATSSSHMDEIWTRNVTRDVTIQFTHNAMWFDTGFMIRFSFYLSFKLIFFTHFYLQNIVNSNNLFVILFYLF